MSTRAFSVFQDIQEQQAIAAQPSSTLLSPSHDKENVHPVTGQLAPLSTVSKPTKKRKSSNAGILATKVQIVPQTDKENAKAKPLSSSSKSRRSTSSTSKHKSGSPKKPKRKPLGSSGNSRSSPPCEPARRRSLSASHPDGNKNTTSIAPSLRIVMEDVEEESFPSKSASEPNLGGQATIDARCYELTVLPLADVSTAYLQSTVEHGSPSRKRSLSADVGFDIKEFRTIKESRSIESRLRDYFSPPPQSAPSSLRISGPSTPKKRKSVLEVFCESPKPIGYDDMATFSNSSEQRCGSPAKELTTPERKRIYAAFTFSSPLQSPAKA